jgi:hypothetical protein
MSSELPLKADIAQHSWPVSNVPTPDIPGAAVVASGRDANRVVAAHLPPTEPRGRSVTLTCFGRSEAAETGSRLQSSDIVHF